ncbi:MAG: tyrosine-type recombinase/integrase [Bacteroidaceae bacterium]|nr:tyrosine-type recombinase/integrase [Bacteroidaceae bacterium]
MQTLNDVKISFNFNLRNPKKVEAETQIYCVVKVNNKQYKMPCGLKVFAYQWDKRKQKCKVLSNMVDSERINNITANRKLSEMKCKIDEIIDYLCTGVSFDSASNIERYIKDSLTIYASNMANKNAIPPKRTITATTLLKKAFDYYYKTNGNQKESTVKQQQNRLKKFFVYIAETKKGDTPRLLTQDGLNDYKEWLIFKANESEKTKMGAKAINDFCQLIARLINDVLSVLSEYRKYHFQQVRYVTVDDSRKKEDKYKRALTEKEVNTFLGYQPKNAKEKEIKDLFILQLNTGVRKGDLVRLVNGEYCTDDEEPDYFIVETEKEGITAVVEREHLDTFDKNYPNGMKQVNVNGTSFESVYNQALKTIFKKCGLTQIEHYKINIAGRNVEASGPLNELISNHFARHTFITFKLREGMRPDRLCYMTGHADDRMIREVYEHLSKTDKIKAVKKEKERINADKKELTLSDNSNDEIIAAQTKENYKLKKQITKLESERDMNEFNSMSFLEQGKLISSIIKDSEIESES